MKRAISLFCGAAIVALSAAAAVASPPNLTGTWTVQQTGLNGTTSSTITLKQSGMGIVGENATTGNGFTGEFVSDTKINGKWHGPGGAGWLTVYASPNGHSFNGSWGYNGRKENGTFVGNKFLPPSPISAAGKWNVTGAGGQSGFAGVMNCTESGIAVVCHSAEHRHQREVPRQGQGPRDLDERHGHGLVLVLVQRRQQLVQRRLGQGQRHDPARRPRRRPALSRRLTLA